MIGVFPISVPSLTADRGSSAVYKSIKYYSPGSVLFPYVESAEGVNIIPALSPYRRGVYGSRESAL